MTFPHNYEDDADFGSPLGAEDAPASFELIPPGKYAAMVTDIKPKETKSGGKMLAITFDLTEQYAGRKVFENLNLMHANEVVRNIARRQICQLLAAAGVEPEGFALRVSSLMEALHGREIVIKLAVEEDKTGKYEPQNRIKGYYEFSPRTEAQAQVQQRAAPAPRPTQQVPPQVATRTGGAQPWKK
jgi:hypothetical protein